MRTNFGGGGFNVFPPFIKFLLFANAGIFLATSFLGLRFGDVSLMEVVQRTFALWPWEYGFQAWQLITYQYLHGGFSHILFNMIALWMFGMELENIWGSRRFAVYYTLAGIAAGVTHMTVTAITGAAPVPTVGASGSIMGVLLAFGMMFPDRPVMIFPIFFPIPARIFVIGYAAIDLILGVSNAQDGVAHFAHLGGALGGFLLIKFGEPLFKWIERLGSSTSGQRTTARVHTVEYRDVDDADDRRMRYQAQVTQPPVVQTATPVTQTPTRFVVNGQPITQEQIDAILDKISHGGYHNLSEQEKNILFEVSRQL